MDVRGIAGRHGLMKAMNTARVADLLRTSGPLSRSALAAESGLDNKTITNIVNDLVSKRLVRAAGLSESSGGRRPELLDLDTDVHFAAGVDLGATHISAVLVDLKGNVLSRKWRSIRPDASRQEIVEAAEGFCTNLRDEAGRNGGHLVGIGFVSPGLIDRGRGVCLLSSNLPNWRDVPIKAILEESLGIPVYVDESARILVWAEKWFGLAKQSDDFACVNLGPGIGLGIMSNGRLYRGATETAGEIGHIIVDVDGPLCRCGNRGCLEAVASGLAIASQARQASERKEDTIIGQIAHGDLDAIDASTVAEAARRGDRLAKQVLERSGRYLGVAIAGVINLFDPGVVILTGGLTKAGDLLLEPLLHSVRSHALPSLSERVRIEVSLLGDDASVLGATVLVLRQILGTSLLGD